MLNSTNIKTWISDLRAVSGAVRVADMSVAAIGAVDYAKALDGLSLKQAQLMLTTQGIVGEEQKDLLVKQGLIATSDRMSASLVSEALANNGLNKEKVEEILIDANLMSQNTKELITENAVTEAKLRAVLAEKGIKGAKADTLVTSILQTGQNAKEAISWDVLAASIKKSMIALAQNPLTWIAVAVGAVVGFIKIVDHFAVTAEKLNEQLQELKATEEELISTQDKLTEIDGKIAEIQSKETLSITDKADISRLEQEKLLLKDEIELLKLRKELQQDEYNKNAKKYADGEYSNYTRGQGDITHLMNSYKGYKAKSERTDIDDYFIEDAKRGLKETEAELIEYRNTINENLANLAPDDEESRKKLETIREAIEKLIYTEEELAKIKFDRFIIDPNNTGISEGFEKIKSDGEVAAQEITDLASKFPTLKRFMDDNGVSAETLAAELNNVGTEAENSDGNVDKMTVSIGDLEKASDKIKTLGSAFKELSDDGHITTKTLGEIKTATGLADDEWKSYENTLLGAKKGSTEFNQAVSDLTYKVLENQLGIDKLANSDEAYIVAVLRENGVLNANVVAQDMITQAKHKQEIQSILTKDATDEEISSLISNAQACGTAKNAYLELVAKEILFNNNDLDVSDKVDKLNKIAVAAGVAGIEMDKLNSKLSGVWGNDRKSYAESYGIEVVKAGMTTNGKGQQVENWQYKYNGETYEELSDAIGMAEAGKLVDKISSSFNGIKVNYGGNTSSSSKNSALDNYLKDAENRYKIHQDETKYIEDLNHALNNLVKTEDERLDVTGKINEAYRDLADNRIKDLEHQIDLTKELKGENADVTAQLSEIQRVSHQEADRLRSMGYDDNSNEIQALQKTWWDAENSKLDFYSKQHEIILRDIEHARDMALETDPFVDTTSYYKQLQEEYHREAERLRALDPEKYKEEIQELQLAWWDAQKSIADWSLSNSERWINERNTYGDWEQYGDNEVAAWKRVLDRFKSEFPSELDKIREIEENYFNARKDAMEKSISDIEDYIDARNHYDDWNSFGDSELEAIKRQTQIIEDAYKQRLLSADEYVKRLEEYSQRIYSLAREQIDESLSDIDRYIDARNHYDDWDAFGDSETDAIKRQCKILDKAYEENLMSLEDYTERSEEYAQKLYSIGQEYINKSLSDIDRYIDTRNAYDDWDNWGDSEIEAIKRQIDILDKAYAEKLLSLEEYTQKTEEYSKKLYSVAKDNIIETISKMIEDYEKMRQDEKDALSFESTQYSSLKTLLQSHYDVTNAIAEAQHEINKELRASKSMYEYLNKETRKLLFNQEDYDVLSEKLLDIQTAANELQEKYNNDILNASEETIAEITSQYQMQYETMMKQYEIAKAELDVAKKRQKLDNVLAERNVRMFINGEWQWVADTQKVIEAENELANAEIEREQKETSLKQIDSINELTKAQDDITTQINYLETDLEKVREAWSKMQKLLNGESHEVAEALKQISQVSSPELKRVIEETGGNVVSFSASLSESIDTMSTVINTNLDTATSDILDNVVESVDDITSTISDSISDIHDNISDGIDNINKTITDGLKEYSDAIKALVDKINSLEIGATSSSGKTSSSSGGSSSSSDSSSKKVNTTDQYVKSSNGIIQSNPNWDGKNKGGVGSFYKHADGTRYTPGGLTALGEEGFEAFINNNGHLVPINQPTIGNIGAGGIVFNQAQMDNLRNLWDLSNINRTLPHISTLADNKQSTVIDNSIHINGLTVGEQGNEDWINGLKRYVATHR